jgi:hypothetical protein
VFAPRERGGDLVQGQQVSAEQHWKDVYDRANRHLRWLPLFVAPSEPVPALSALGVWSLSKEMQGGATRELCDSLVAHTIESQLFTLAIAQFSVPDSAALSLPDCGVLMDVVLQHAERTASQLRMQPTLPARLLVEQRSLVTLLAWLSYALVHRAASSAHPLLVEFGMALRFDHLQHLVLADGRARHALPLVCGYLRQRPALARGPGGVRHAAASRHARVCAPLLGARPVAASAAVSSARARPRQNRQTMVQNPVAEGATRAARRAAHQRYRQAQRGQRSMRNDHGEPGWRE